MKKLALLASTLAVLVPGAGTALAANVSVGHSGWFWGNPQPQGNTLRVIDFAGGTGYSAGDFGTLLKTTDAGLTWTGIATGVTADLQQVRVLDPNTVFIGAGCLLRRSDDGGMTFRRIMFATSERSCPSGVQSFHFVNANVGYLLLQNGTVERTDDGGASFALKTAVPGTQAAGGQTGPGDIFFTSTDSGFAAAGNVLYRTTDGGGSWTQVATAPGATLSTIYFPTTTDGYAIGTGKTVLRTSDGGATWGPKPIPGDFPPADLVRASCAPGSAALCIFSTKQGDQLLRTTDGGDTWTSVKPSSSPIFAAAFNTVNSVAAVGADGATAISGDGGDHWAPVGSSPLAGATFTRLRATSSSVVAAPGLSGTLARTTDGGHTWSKVGVATSQAVIDASFPNATVGFALDSSGTLFRSGDGGAHWTPLDTGTTTAPRAVYAPDQNTVILVGPRGVLRSQNAGDPSPLFTETVTRSAQKALLVDFDSTASGQLFVFGPRALFVTSNKGSSFTAVRRPGGRRASIRDVDFLSGKVGYVLTTDGRIWATTNGGKKWKELPATGTSNGIDMSWGDAKNGYLTTRGFGGDFQRGFVLRTSDGGQSWRPQLVSPHELAPNGLVATAAQSAFGLTAPNLLFFTEVGGDQGAQSILSIKANRKSIPRKGATVTITGKLSPALVGEDVVVEIRDVRGGSWHVVLPKPTASGGTFTIKRKLRRSSYIVAQWAGDADTNGDGSNLLTIKRK